MPSGTYIRKNKKTPGEVKKTRQLIWQKYYSNNKEKLLAKSKIRKKNNPEKYIEYEKKRYAKRPEYYKEKHKIYSKNNRDVVNRYVKKKYQEDLQFKIKCILRARLVSALKNNQKKGNTLKIIGCSVPELVLHIENQFKDGMNWNNWKYKGWHIDHIIPISSFDLSKKEELLKACHYTNLQPLWGIDNHKKGNKKISTGCAQIVLDGGGGGAIIELLVN